MIRNLFSSFDPCASYIIFTNWFSIGLCFIIIPSIYWVVNNRLSISLIKLIITIHKDFKTLLGETSRGLTLVFIRVLLFIIFNNFLGLFPYIFTSTRHLVVSLALALPLWLRFILYGWWNNTNHIFAHLVPLSTPPVLIPFMVLIETISNLIRPGTLTVRLTANIIAGHLLLTLLSTQTTYSSNTLIFLTLLSIQVALLLLEAAVAFIQAYVFRVLTTLYSREV